MDETLLRRKLRDLHEQLEPLGPLPTLITMIRDRVTAYVDAQSYRADVVQTLPVSAPRGYLMVTPGDPNLYVGTGMANPLRKLPTLPV